MKQDNPLERPMPFLYLHPYAIAMTLFVVAFLGLGLVMLFSMAIGGSGETILIAFVPLLLGFFGNSTINGYLNTKAVSAVKLSASLHHFPRNSLRYTVLKGCIREQLKAAAPITYGELMTCGEYLRTAQKARSAGAYAMAQKAIAEKQNQAVFRPSAT
jgi:hypothetical protein